MDWREAQAWGQALHEEGIKNEVGFQDYSPTPPRVALCTGARVAGNIAPVAWDSSSASTTQEELRLDFGSKVPLRTPVIRQLILTNCSPIQTPFTLTLEYFGSSQDSLYKKASV